MSHLASMAPELGLHGLVVPQVLGGAGSGLVELAIVLEEFGRRLVSAPFLSTPLATLALVNGDAAVAGDVLRGIVDGDTVAAVAVAEETGGWESMDVACRAERSGDGWRLHGVKSYVADGMSADVFVVAARAVDGVGFFLVDADASGLSREALEVFDLTRPMARLDLDRVEARPREPILAPSNGFSTRSGSPSRRNRQAAPSSPWDGRRVRQGPGVVRADFNEVFFTDASVPDANRPGGLSEGWRVLQTARGFERLIMGAKAGESTNDERPTGPKAELAARQSPSTRNVGDADYIELVGVVGKSADPVTRQDVVRLYALDKVDASNALRAWAEGGSSSFASIGKLSTSRIVLTGVWVTGDLLGSKWVLTSDTSPVAGGVNRSSFAALVSSIGGGTDQLQRNIIGERILGLPREPELERDVPFSDVRKAGPTGSFS